MRILRRRTLERRLFKWLLGLALVPALIVLAVTTWVGRGTLDWLGSLGPWTQVASTGRALIEAAEPAAAQDPRLAAAAERHQAELERSLTQAQRWSYLGNRLISILPLALIGFAFFLAVLALLVSRKLARGLSRPIQELATWTERIAKAEPLPAPAPRERREVREVQTLRQSLRRAADELQSARARALQQERTRAWGELARRLAHEMKNPLTPLRLAAHRLAEAAERDPSLREPLRVVDEEITRLELLAREFGQLGRPVEGPRSAVDLGELLVALIATDIPAGIAARLNVPAEPIEVFADYNALQQAFRNVLRNAVEAVESRAQPVIAVTLAADGDDAVVTISDNGPGIEAAALNRVFEPDFTTKPRGTGLGLTIVRQTIEAHQGSVTAGAALEGGASLIIRLPRPTRPAPAGPVAALLLLLVAAAGCASVSTSPGPELRVMTYNIHAGKDAAQVPNLERVADVVKSNGADIVLLQEVDRGTQRSGGEDQIATLARLTGMHSAFARSLDYQGGQYGIALLSRFPIDSAHTVPLEVQPRVERSGSPYEPRVGLHAVIRSPMGELHVLNTHVDAAATPTFRHQEVIGLLAHVQQHVPAGARIILGGDLNARPHTPEIAAVQLAFADSWARCGDGGMGFTFPAHAPDRRIDYLMLRGVDCGRARVVETQASDHRPMLITIR